MAFDLHNFVEWYSCDYVQHCCCDGNSDCYCYLFYESHFEQTLILSNMLVGDEFGVEYLFVDYCLRYDHDYFDSELLRFEIF